jgi:hypothetical protein
VNTYLTTALFRCPNNSCVDYYTIQVRSPEMIQVEAITKALATAPRRIYQEDLADFLFTRLGAEISVTGWHQGVLVTSVRP